MTGEKPFTYPLKPGFENRINNPNPATWEVQIETTSGSKIGFIVPAGGSFKITPMQDIRDVTINVVEVTPYGPRPVD